MLYCMFLCFLASAVFGSVVPEGKYSGSRVFGSVVPEGNYSGSRAAFTLSLDSHSDSTVDMLLSMGVPILDVKKVPVVKRGIRGLRNCR